MSRALRIAALGAAALLAACGDDDVVSPGLNLAEPSAVVPFRGVTTKDPGNKVHAYLAIANSATNDVTVIDAVDDSIVPAPVPLRALVVPVPGRPALLASADLGDGKPDLLLAVSAGDSRLQVVRTWTAVNAVEREEDLGADVLAIAAVPSPQGTARIAAALAGRRIAIVEFRRQADSDAIEPLPTPPPAATFAFQPVALAALPDGDPGPAADTKLYAASLEEIATGVHGVAELAVPTGAPPSLLGALDAGAPTRLVTAARLRESVGSPALDGSAFTGSPVERAYAVLDESGCGLAAPIACGLVALAPETGGLAADPAGELPHRAPIPIPGQPLALAAAPPPAQAPSDLEPQYAVTFMRVQTAVGARATTAVAAVASTNGSVTFVDLGRWEIPSEQAVHTNVGATVTPGTTATNQWLVLFDPTSSTTVAHGDAQGLANAFAGALTPGYTPTARWTATYQGALPGLSSRRAHAPGGGLLALQVPGPVPGTVPAFTEIVRLYDPVLGVQVGDVVVVEAGGLAGCNATFEAEVDDFLQPIPTAYPGGAVRLRKKLDPQHPEWDACVDALAEPAAGLRATFLAGEYVLVRGSGSSALHVGRPRLGEAFEVRWLGEVEPACSVVPWPVAPGSCDAACRTACERLLQSRMARRIAYAEPCGTDATCNARWSALERPALRFTLALETAAPPPRGLTLAIDTRDGRTPFQVVPASGAPVEPRAIATFDRSPYTPSSGVRFLVPYAGGLVLDATPTVQGGNAVVIR